MSDPVMLIQPSTTVIRDVCNSFKKHLAANINDLPEGNIGFESPADFTAGSAKSLSLFLFQVKLDPYQRNGPTRAALLEDGTLSENQFKEAPVVLDLTCMLTPFGPDRIVEMELLEEIIGVLYDKPVLAEDVLEEGLVAQGNKKIRITPKEYSVETINNIWSIFPSKAYKISLFYSLNPVNILPAKTFVLHGVAEKNINVVRK